MGHEIVMFIGWVALPLMAYCAGQMAIRVTRHRLPAQLPLDPERRLAELRLQRDAGTLIIRGRMADALRLAEDTAPSGSLPTRQH